MIWLGVALFIVLPGIVLVEVSRSVWLEYRRDRVPILLYHRLIAREAVRQGRVRDDEPIYACYDDVFEGQMRWLADHGYTTLGLDEFHAARTGAGRLPDKALVITFDDGYASNYTLAFPALRRHGHKATIFVAPQPDEHTRSIVHGIDGFLTPEQMRELDRNGVAIESHTLTHCVLADQDDATARHELFESNRLLGEILGRPIRHLAIPRDGYSRRIRHIVREVGYRTVCCNAKGSSNGWSNLMALPRIVIERDMSVEDFGRALSSRTGLMLRLVGNVKRLPGLALGATRAARLRRRLYHSPAARMFQTRQLKRVLGMGAIVYAVGALCFTWYLLRQ